MAATLFSPWINPAICHYLLELMQLHGGVSYTQLLVYTVIHFRLKYLAYLACGTAGLSTELMHFGQISIYTIDREIFTLKIICAKNFRVDKFLRFGSIIEIFWSKLFHSRVKFSRSVSTAKLYLTVKISRSTVDHYCKRRKTWWSPGNDDEFIIIPFPTNWYYHIDMWERELYTFILQHFWKIWRRATRCEIIV